MNHPPLPPRRPSAWYETLSRWIVDTTRESRLARLSTIGLSIPCDRETSSERWHEVIWLRER